MFEALRRMILPIILVALFAFVAMIVLQWGLGVSQRQDFVQSNTAAVINGEEVPWDAYNRIYDNLYRAESKDGQEDITDDKVRQLQSEAWKQLLHDRLILQEAARNKIAVTNDELFSYLRQTPPSDIQQLPYFQTEGRFDYQKYINAMADPNYAPLWAQIEPFVKAEITKLKMQEAILQTVHVTEEEVKYAYSRPREKIKVGLIDVPYSRFSRPPPKSTDEELQAFYEERLDDYPIDERAALNIVLIEKKPEQLDWEVAYNKALSIRDSITTEGADFAEMAEIYSQDPGSAVKGGDLGWFPRGQMVPEFDRYAFSMDSGQVSEPFRSQFGWHIISHRGYKEEMEVPRGKTVKELVRKALASHILIKAEPSQGSLDKVYNRLEDFRQLAEDIGFFAAAEQMEMAAKSTALFFRGGNIQFIGSVASAGLFAFEKEIDDISPVFENNSAYFVVQVNEQIPARMATFEEAKEKVKIDIVKFKVTATCTDTINAIWKEIQSGANYATAASRHGAEYTETDEFDRGTYVKPIGRDPVAVGAAFSLTSKGQSTGPIDYDQGSVIIKLLARGDLDLTDFTNKHDSLYQVIVQLKSQELYGRWFDQLVKSSDIVNNVQRSLQPETDFL
ncbi:MAG: peptidylprolyl isomerase [Candidatus Zixiibacteriota bacterium]